MKNLLLTALFFFLLIFQIKAQYIALNEEPEIKISQNALNWENQKLRSDLTLTDNQFEQIKDITLERSKARSIVSKMFKYEPNKLHNKLQEIDSQFEGEFAQVLNAKQFKKFLALQARKVSDVKEADQAINQTEGANFNTRIQQMITQATAPAIDPKLLPKQGASSLANQDSLQIQTAGIGNENVISRDKAGGNESLVPVNINEAKPVTDISEKEALNLKTDSHIDTRIDSKTEEIQKSE